MRHPGWITWESVGLLIGVALTVTATWTMFRRAPAAAPRITRFQSCLPQHNRFRFNQPIASSRSHPTEHTSVRSNTGQLTGQLMVRALDGLEFRPLAGISNARAPFISPDGR
jgi:hypothetical protein